MLSVRRLAEIMRDLAAIPHVRIIRIHSRVRERVRSHQC